MSAAEKNYDVENWELAGDRVALYGVYQPQEPGLHPDGEETELLTGQMGAVLWLL